MTFTVQLARESVRCAKAELQEMIINFGRSPERLEKMRQLYELEDCLKCLSSTNPDRAWTAIRDCDLRSPRGGTLLRVEQIVPLRFLEPDASKAAAPGTEEGATEDAMHYDCPRCTELYPLVARREPPTKDGAPAKTTVSVLCLRCLRLSPIAQSD